MQKLRKYVCERLRSIFIVLPTKVTHCKGTKLTKMKCRPILNATIFHSIRLTPFLIKNTILRPLWSENVAQNIELAYKTYSLGDHVLFSNVFLCENYLSEILNTKFFNGFFCWKVFLQFTNSRKSFFLSKCNPAKIILFISCCTFRTFF